MEIPLINGNTTALYPEDNLCPVCNADIEEPNSFLLFTGGALKDNKDGDLTMDDDLYGFLDLRFHGAFGTGVGNHKDKYIDMEIVKNATQGQFGLSFCSTECFRKFINELIDDLEKELEKNYNPDI